MKNRPSWHSASKPEWKEACRREAVIRPLVVEGSVSNAQADQAAQELGVSRSLVYRLVARYRQRAQTSTLLSVPRGRTEQTQWLDKEVETLIRSAVERIYLQREQPRVSDLFRAIRADCQRFGLKPPSYNTVHARLLSLDPKEVTRRRIGAAAARQRFTPVGTSSLQPTLPLEVVQIDHTLVDVLVVDELERLPLGRPWLTLAIDVASRMVTGFYVSLDAPSILSVALALTQAVLPKDLWLCDRELEMAWPACGLPEFLHLDNAPEFKSEALERGTREYGINLLYRPIGRPHFGGHIERLIGTVMGAVHLLPGTTFASVTKKGSYRPEKRASLTLLELERWLALEIVGVYHHTVHSSLHQTPATAWQRGLAQRPRPARQPQDRERFFLDFLPVERRQIRRDGIRLFHLHYWHNVLSPQAGRSKIRELIKYDPRNLSRVYWQDQQGNYWPIPYRNLALPPISLWEHDEAVRRLKAESQREVDENKLVAMVLQQRRLVEEARTKTARRRRGRQPPDDQCTLEADTGRLRVTTAQPNEQDTEIEELKEVAPFPVDIDP